MFIRTIFPMSKTAFLIVTFLSSSCLTYSQSPPAAPFYLIGCEDKCDNEIVSAFSNNGTNFSWAPAWKPDASLNCMHDHTLLYYNDKVHKPYWLCACSAATNHGSAVDDDSFGLARSDDLLHWTQLPSVAPAGIKNKILETWSPYLFQDPADGSVYAFVAIGTDVDWKGIGYMKCLDPGTWTRWTEWKPFSPLQHQNIGKYNGPAVYYLNGKYWFFFDDYSHQNGYPSAEAYITSSSGLLSGYGAPTYIPSLNSVLPLDDNFLKKEFKQYRYEGMSLVRMNAPVWRIYVQAIGKVNGLALGDIMGFIESDDNMKTWGAFQLLRDSNSNVALFRASHVYRLEDVMTGSPSK